MIKKLKFKAFVTKEKQLIIQKRFTLKTLIKKFQSPTRVFLTAVAEHVMAFTGIDQWF